jgi:hypothetical protein
MENDMRMTCEHVLSEIRTTPGSAITLQLEGYNGLLSPQKSTKDSGLIDWLKANFSGQTLEVEKETSVVEKPIADVLGPTYTAADPSMTIEVETITALVILIPAVDDQANWRGEDAS